MAFDKKKSHLMFYLLLVLLAAVLLRWSYISTKQTIGHDEAISYLSATCNQERYQQEQGSWARPAFASEWKEYLRLSEPLCFGEISRGLAGYDVHPPLYFWGLHLWTIIFGVAPWTGPSFNVAISLLTSAMIFGLAKKTLRNREMALLVLFTYALNMVVVEVSLIARQYELLALWTILLVWLILNLTGQRKTHEARNLFFLAIVILAGTLTHFQFLIPAAASAVYAAIKLIKKDVPRLIRIWVALAAGFVLAQLIFPGFSIVLESQSGIATSFSPDAFRDRIITVLYSFYSFYYVFFIALVLALILFVLRKRKVLVPVEAPAHAGRRVDWIWFFLLWILGAIVILYLSFRSPGHAMGARYLSMIWPFMAFLPYFVLRAVNFRKTVVMYFYLIPGVIVLASLVGNALLPPAGPAAIFQDADTLLFDNPARGIFLPQLIHVPEDKVVVVGSQEQLIADSVAWLPQISEESLYVSTLEYASSAEGRDQILAAIKEAGFDVSSTSDQPFIKDTIIYRFCSRGSTDCP